MPYIKNKKELTQIKIQANVVVMHDKQWLEQVFFQLIQNVSNVTLKMNLLFWMNG